MNMAMRATLSALTLPATLALASALGCISSAPEKEHWPATFLNPDHTVQVPVWSEQASRRRKW